MKEDNVTKILFEGWWEFEYNNDDGTLTDNKSVCIGKVPKEEISNALFMIEVMYSSYGFIYKRDRNRFSNFSITN